MGDSTSSVEQLTALMAAFLHRMETVSTASTVPQALELQTGTSSAVDALVASNLRVAGIQHIRRPMLRSTGAADVSNWLAELAAMEAQYAIQGVTGAGVPKAHQLIPHTLLREIEFVLEPQLPPRRDSEGQPVFDKDGVTERVTVLELQHHELTALMRDNFVVKAPVATTTIQTAVKEGVRFSPSWASEPNAIFHLREKVIGVLLAAGHGDAVLDFTTGRARFKDFHREVWRGLRDKLPGNLQLVVDRAMHTSSSRVMPMDRIFMVMHDYWRERVTASLELDSSMRRLGKPAVTFSDGLKPSLKVSPPPIVTTSDSLSPKSGTSSPSSARPLAGPSSPRGTCYALKYDGFCPRVDCKYEHRGADGSLLKNWPRTGGSDQAPGRASMSRDRAALGIEQSAGAPVTGIQTRSGAELPRGVPKAILPRTAPPTSPTSGARGVSMNYAGPAVMDDGCCLMKVMGEPDSSSIEVPIVLDSGAGVNFISRAAVELLHKTTPGLQLLSDPSVSFVDFKGTRSRSSERVDGLNLETMRPHGTVRVTGISAYVTEDSRLLFGIGRALCQELGVFVPLTKVGERTVVFASMSPSVKSTQPMMRMVPEVSFVAMDYLKEKVEALVANYCDASSLVRLFCDRIGAKSPVIQSDVTKLNGEDCSSMWRLGIWVMLSYLTTGLLHLRMIDPVSCLLLHGLWAYIFYLHKLEPLVFQSRISSPVLSVNTCSDVSTSSFLGSSIQSVMSLFNSLVISLRTCFIWSAAWRFVSYDLRRDLNADDDPSVNL